MNKSITTPAKAAGIPHSGRHSIAFSCSLAVSAGYVAGLVAKPRHFQAGLNVAVGVTVAFGLQNVIAYRNHDLPLWYFITLPTAAAIAAVIGGLLSKSLQAGREQE